MNLEILLSAIKAKDKNAFNVLYDETINRVYSLAYKITYSSDLAEEVVADVYLQVWQQADRFDSRKGGAMGWMLLICRTRALDLLRKNKRINEKTEEYIDDDNHQSQDTDILELMDSKSAVYEALSKLSPQQQQLLSLVYFKGYTHAELVSVTGMPLGTVKTNLRRSLILMQQHLLSNQQ